MRIQSIHQKLSVSSFQTTRWILQIINCEINNYEISSHIYQIIKTETELLLRKIFMTNLQIMLKTFHNFKKISLWKIHIMKSSVMILQIFQMTSCKKIFILQKLITVSQIIKASTIIQNITTVTLNFLLIISFTVIWLNVNYLCCRSVISI